MTKLMVIRTIGLASLLLASLSGPVLAGYTPPTFSGTGPYERVYSDTGYSYMSASVYLPGVPQIKIAPGTGDTPYIYMGGWGAGGASATDAGLQYSPTYNDWSLFLSVYGIGRIDFGTTNTRLNANQTVTLTFAITQVGSNVDLTVSVTGVQINTNQVVTQSLTLQNAAGWSAGAGNQDTLKRMTTIGQSHENLIDGSAINGVAWSNVTLGQSAADAVAWSGGGSQSYPGTPGVVSVNYLNGANQTDSINLVMVPEPQSWALLATGLVFALGYFWQTGTRRSAVAPQTSP